MDQETSGIFVLLHLPGFIPRASGTWREVKIGHAAGIFVRGRGVRPIEPPQVLWIAIVGLGMPKMAEKGML